MGYKHTSFSSAGRDRKFNEDAVEILELDGGLLTILCDGVGGDFTGDIAANIAAKTATSFFCSYSSPDYLERIKDTFNETNNFLVSRSALKNGNNNLATTLEIVFFKDNFAYWGHIGDSRIYQVKGKRIYQITKDHSLVQKLLDEGFINHKQANNHPQKNVIIQALGDSTNIIPDVSIIKMNDLEFNRFFICSDGITNLLSNKELEDLLTLDDLEEIKSRLCKVVKTRGAPDDYSFIIVEKTR